MFLEIDYNIDLWPEARQELAHATKSTLYFVRVDSTIVTQSIGKDDVIAWKDEYPNLYEYLFGLLFDEERVRLRVINVPISKSSITDSD